MKKRTVSCGGSAAAARLGAKYSVLLLAPLTLGQPALASSDGAADAGVIAESLRRADARPALPRPAAKTVIRAQQPRVQSALQGLRMSLGGFRFEGDIGVKPEELDKVLAPWAGRELSFAEYEEAVHALAAYLRSHGHPDAEVRISRAQVRDQQIAIAIQGLNPPAPTQMAQAPVEPEAPPQQLEPRVFVKSFKVEGATLASAAELQASLAPFAERALTLKELDLAAGAVAALLQDKGYGLAQAYLPPQRIDGGEVTIAVQQGVVEAEQGLRVAGAGTRVKPELVQRLLVDAVPAGEPLKTSALDAALRVVGEVPGVKAVRATLAAGAQPGSTRVTAEVDETRLFSGAFWADNHGSRYIGEQRQNALLLLNSPSGHGEQYNLTLSRSRDMDSFKLGGQLLAGERGLKLGAAWSEMRMNLGAEVAALDLNSNSSIFSLYGSLPLQRGAQRNLTLSANLDLKSFSNSFFNAGEQKRRIAVSSVTGQGDALDGFGGQWAWALTGSAGRVDLGSSPELAAMDRLTAKTGGGFGKLNASISRLAPVAGLPGLAFYGSLSGQLASGNLDGAEKFQLGGPTGVRAYPVGEGLGDEGWIASGELRWSLALPRLESQLQLFAFYDVGALRQYKRLWSQALPPGSPNRYHLQGMGVGAQIVYQDMGSIKAVFASKAGSNPNPGAGSGDSDGQARSGRIWVIGNIAF